MTLHAQSIRKVAEWPTPGALYASQVRTIDGVKYLIGQGGTLSLPWGDPLSLWSAEGEEIFSPVNIPGRPHNGTNVIVQTDSPLINPHMSYDGFIAVHHETRCGSTAMGTWDKRADGLFDLWSVPAYGNPSDVGGAYEQEFVLNRAVSADRQTWVGYDYNNKVGNIALAQAALRMTDKVTPLADGKTSYPFAHGIGGCAAVTADGVLYLMLKCFYELPIGFGKGQQKNVLVRSFDDGETFEAWMTNGPNAWAPCANGLIPQELFAHGFAPHSWPIDSLYETPPALVSQPRSRRYMALVGQPVSPQLAIAFSDNLMEWGPEVEIELPSSPKTVVSAALRAKAMAGVKTQQMPPTRDIVIRRYQQQVHPVSSLGLMASALSGWSNINYRTMDPDSGRIYFGSDVDGDMATYEVIVPELVKAKRRATRG